MVAIASFLFTKFSSRDDFHNLVIAHFNSNGSSPQINRDAKFAFDQRSFPVYRLRPMSSDTQLTPMMAQYRRIKSELPADALLLFRLGDFYEMFFEDAQTGAQLLNVALTRRGVIPMCGIPFHAANNYIARILRAGRKVAICDQVEEARPGQLVKREVTQILSPW